ncbi:MAG: hypothetical protein VR73_07450 [Gammaproteobacteria bacterium BRH_c0]|nr:MAG: hypothetical protein VR73_07450 [Gammaproteobacteria bacterium BRH_c0]
MKLTAFIAALVVSLLTFSPLASAAAEPGVSPHQLVEEVTEKLLGDIARYRDALDSAGGEKEKNALINQFFDQLNSTLQPVVDFPWIALNVMGKHRKDATPEQIADFTKAFTRGLVETYGRGLLSYSDQKIVVIPASEAVGDKRRVTVRQEIQGADAKYPLLYSMGLNRKGEWKVVNVIINGINLGSTFRNQFAQAYAQNNGDMDKVIANWAAQVPQG